MSSTDRTDDPEAPLGPDEFDRIFAESAGPYLRTYLTLHLSEREPRPDLAHALEDVYAGLLASGALIYSGERKGFQTRLYGLVDRILPHLGQPALRKPRSPELEARAQRFAQLVAQTWHGGFDDHVRAIESLGSKERPAILRRDFHEWTMQEIARELGMPIDEARAFVRGAQERVRTWKAPQLSVGD
jgi:hypothetical protein